MKKLILLLFIPLVFACSSDDSVDSNQSENENFDNYPKLISYTREHPNLCDGIYWNIQYSYSGDKIISTSTTVYYDYINSSGEECIYYGDEGYINNIVNNVYSGDVLVSQNVIFYNSDGLQNSNILILYEYDDNGLLSKMTRQDLDNDGNLNFENETVYFWTNNNLTRQATNSNGQILEVKTYDSYYNCLETIFYENGQVVQTSSFSFDMTKYNALANSNKYWAWFGAGPRNHNQVVFENIVNVSDNLSNEKFYENTYNEYGFPTYVLRDKLEHVTMLDSIYWPRIYKYYYE